jgi:hypothetical protein
MKSVAGRLRSRIVIAGILAASGVVGGTTLTNAAWVDNEYVYASGVGTDGRCELDSGTLSTASARQLRGTLMGSDLDNLASVSGVSVLNDGAGTSTANPGAIRIDDNTFMAPLDVDLLRADVLQLSLPLGLPVGSADVYSQWGRTLHNGNTTAASGLITDSAGALGLGQSQNPTDPPTMATLDLGALAPAELAGMTLEIGSASSIAELTQCGDLGNGWLGPLAQPLVERSYAVSSLDLDATVPALDSAVSGADQLLDGVQPSLNTASGDLEVAIAGDLAVAATPLLGTLTLGGIDTQVTMTSVDLAPVQALLTGEMTDDSGLLTVNFGTGVVQVDLAKTAGGVNGLNGMAPNTEVILNQAVMDDLSAALTQVLDDWKENVKSALVTAIRATSVTVAATVHVRSLGLPLADINLGLGPVSAGELLDLYNGVPGTPAVPVTSSITMLGLGDPTPTLNALASGLAAALPGITGEALNHGLILGIVGSVETSLGNLTSTVAPALSDALGQLSSLLSITVNVQPDQPGHPAPSTASPFSVSALRLSFVALNTLELSLATSSVGYGN